MIPPHPLTNFERQTCHQNEPKFYGFQEISRNSLLKIKYGTYIINLDEFKSTGAHWVALYVNGNTTIYFDSLGVEHIPK